jgi:hypothetical protein
MFGDFVFDILDSIKLCLLSIENLLEANLLISLIKEVWLGVHGQKTLPNSASYKHFSCTSHHHGLHRDVAHRVANAACSEARETVHRAMDSMLGQLGTQLCVTCVCRHRSDRISRVNSRHKTVHTMNFFRILSYMLLQIEANIVINQIS